MRKLNKKQIVAICAWLAVCVYCVLDRKAFYGTLWNMYDRLGVALITACMTVVFLSDKERQRIQKMIRRKKERKDGKEKTMKIEGVMYPHAYLWKASCKSLKMAVALMTGGLFTLPRMSPRKAVKSNEIVGNKI